MWAGVLYSRFGADQAGIRLAFGFGFGGNLGILIEFSEEGQRICSSGMSHHFYLV